MDEIHENESAMNMAHGQPAYKHQVHYMQDRDHHGLHQHLSSRNVMHHDEHDNDGVTGGGGSEALEGDIQSDPGNLSDNQLALAARGRSEENNQLTLSFQGQVYVFDYVSPEKVQAVLLLLGGREVPPSMPTIPVTPQQSSKGLSSTPQRFNVPQRLASLIRFREKRKERNFDKKIRYTVRKEVALRMQRNKGQFTSSKPQNDDSTSAATSWDSNHSWGLDGSGSQHQDTVLIFVTSR